MFSWLSDLSVGASPAPSAVAVPLACSAAAAVSVPLTCSAAAVALELVAAAAAAVACPLLSPSIFIALDPSSLRLDGVTTVGSAGTYLPPSDSTFDVSSLSAPRFSPTPGFAVAIANGEKKFWIIGLWVNLR